MEKFFDNLGIAEIAVGFEFKNPDIAGIGKGRKKGKMIDPSIALGMTSSGGNR